MIYYHISGLKKNYSIFTRGTKNVFPFITRLYTGRMWKTEKGIHRYVARKYPEWKFESNEQLRERREAYREVYKVIKKSK